MTKSEKQWWEQMRAKGYNHFLLRSLLRAGLPFGTLMTLAAVFSHPIPEIWELLVKFGFYVVGFGATMGAVTWRGNERNYNKPTEYDDV